MATYLGNPSLSTAVKDRVSSTFQQAVALYKQGRTEEVLAGCDLILKMDPQFDPARKLLEKTRNPMSPIDVDQLTPTSAADNALTMARAAMAARDFQKVVNITTEVLTEDLLNDDARILGDEARDKMEAAPFVEQFFRKCEQHVADGNLPAAKGDLDKARALDAEHPAIARMLSMLGGGASPAPAAPTSTPTAAPSFSFDAPAAPSPFGFGGSGTTPSFVVEQPSGGSRSTADASDFGFTFEEEKPAMPSGGFSFDQVSSNPAPQRPAPPPAPPAAAPFSFGAPDPAGFSFDAPPKPPSSFDFQPTAQPPAAGFSFDAPAPPAPAFSFDAPPAPAPAPGGFGFGAPASPEPSGFSFGEAAAPEASGFGFGAPAASGGFDFSAPASGTDDQKKIEQYLADGDRAFSGGDYQHAIDLWSRIFLIDVTNEFASDRIERAKGKRREVEQRVEGLHDAATAALERGDEAGARGKLNEVLQLDPGNSSALEALERLARNEKYEEEPIPPSSPDAFDDMFDDSRDSPFEDSVNEGAIIRPPDGGPVAPAPDKGKSEPKAVTPSSKASKSKVAGLLVPLIAAIVVSAGGYFVYTKFFAAPPVEQASGATTIKQATALAARGQYDQAVALLQEIKPDDPMHDKALELMADYQHSKVKSSELANGRPAEQTYNDDVAAARVAYEGHDYITAKKLLDEASRVHPLPPDLKQIYDASAQQVSKLDSALALFKEGKYQDAVTNLEPLLLQDPQNASVKQLLANAHFNLGAQALQAEHIEEAVKQFDIVLAGNAADEAAKRSKDLAQKYQNQPKDLLYKIYVKYLPLR